MAETAYHVLYRDEWIKAFERDKTTLRGTVTTEAMIKGRQAVFLLADAIARSAVTRGNDGLIPASTDNLEQKTVTLAEKHDLSRKTGFNLFAGQSDQRAIMIDLTRGVINREIDDVIIAMVGTGTVYANATASIMTKQLISKALTTLYNGNVPNDGMITGLLTPAAWAHLSDIPDFASADYVDNKVMGDGMKEIKRWLGVHWMVHTGLPNIGLSTAESYIYHKKAVGHAYDRSDIQAFADYDREQDYSWARTTIYHGALLLQNTGIVKIRHDDSQYSV